MLRQFINTAITALFSALEYINKSDREAEVRQNLFYEVREQFNKVAEQLQTTDVLKLNTGNFLDVSDNQNKGETETMNFKNKIYKRNNGLLEYNDTVNGVRVTAYGRTQRELWQSYTKKKKAVTSGKKVKKKLRPGFIKLHEWLDQWLDVYKSGKIAYETEKTYATYISFIKKSLPDMPLNKLSAITIQIFLNNLETDRKKKAYHTLLNDCLRKATAVKLIKDNPMTAVENVKYTAVRGSALTLEEEATFLEVLDELENQEYSAYFKFCLWTGCRRGEAISVEWKDICFEKKQIHIRGTKNTTSNRYIPLSNRVARLLGGLKKDGGRLFKFSPDTATDIFKTLVPNHKLHDLRHTFATRCLERGVSMKTVQAWLGHSTFEMTANTYSHVQDSFSQAEIEKIDD